MNAWLFALIVGLSIACGLYGFWCFLYSVANEERDHVDSDTDYDGDDD